MNVQSISSLPCLHVVTAHGKLVLTPLSGRETLLELLVRSRIPWSAVSIFGFQNAEQGFSLSSLDVNFDELRGASHLEAHFNRNINPQMFNILEYDKARASGGSEVCSFIFQNVNNDAGTIKNVMKGLSQAECQEIICRNVHDFVQANISPHERLVVGVSGGGDSNSLLLGLTSFKDFPIDIRPVIMKSIPDWDAGVPRAQALCEKYKLHLRVVPEHEVRHICGLPAEEDLIRTYESIFPGDDFEFLGTLIIRRVLTAIAKKADASVVTGLNLEDILSESLLHVSHGKKPLPFPVRRIDGMKFSYPLWMCPKKIIDGCFPRFSVENYAMRYPCFSVGRNLYYMMAYTLQSQFPGSVEPFLRGLQALRTDHSVGIDIPGELDFAVSTDVRAKFNKWIKSGLPMT
ncbi:hypothetical protein [Dyella choica]|uniref:Uncharacterized protein n=1 Tax=Dyella choica TaxID=1927959 RepID=A0A432M580_9GAMM|nr:hypothetical protein [Dyella choica]RUL74958.1 hypothetical protein EKH80_12830 [Dyella choica]